jgi:hypothetical protein
MTRFVSAASVRLLLQWRWMLVAMIMLGGISAAPSSSSSSSAEGSKPGSDCENNCNDLEAAHVPGDPDIRQGSSFLHELGEWDGSLDDILEMSQAMGVRQAWWDEEEEGTDNDNDSDDHFENQPPISENALRFRNKLLGDHEYYKEFVSDESYRHLHGRCRNQEEMCTVWALQPGDEDEDDNEEDAAATAIASECDRNFRYMKLHCPVACRSCLWLDEKARCAPDPNQTDALQAGDLDRLFERIVADPVLVEQFQPEVLSRPAYYNTDKGGGGADPREGAGGGMWLVSFPAFLTEDEADRMAHLAEQSGLRPSEGTLESETGEEEEEAITVTTEARTSWNTVREESKQELKLGERLANDDARASHHQMSALGTNTQTTRTGSGATRDVPTTRPTSGCWIAPNCCCWEHRFRGRTLSTRSCCGTFPASTTNGTRTISARICRCPWAPESSPCSCTCPT